MEVTTSAAVSKDPTADTTAVSITVPPEGTPQSNKDPDEDLTVHDDTNKVPPDVTVLSNTTVITSASVVTVSSQVQYNKDPDEDLNVPPDVPASVSAVPDATTLEAALQDVSCPASITEL